MPWMLKSGKSTDVSGSVKFTFPRFGEDVKTVWGLGFWAFDFFFFWVWVCVEGILLD